MVFGSGSRRDALREEVISDHCDLRAHASNFGIRTRMKYHQVAKVEDVCPQSGSDPRCKSEDLGVVGSHLTSHILSFRSRRCRSRSRSVIRRRRLSATERRDLA